MALYHDTDNGPVEVQKHQIMDPVGYTVVGSPTITDGVASGFSASNYLQLSSYLNIPASSDFEMQFKFTLDEDVSADRYIFTGGYDGTGYSAGLHLTPDRKLYVEFWGLAVFLTSNMFTLGHTNVIKLVRSNNSQITLYVSDNGGDFEVWGTATSSAAYNPTTYLPVIGNSLTSQKSPFVSGSIDLNSSYIKVDSKMWFFQPQETKYIIRENPTTHAQHLVYAKPNMYLSGPVNYTTVGTPTIVDNVASGFSDSNYLQAGSHITFNNNSSVEFNVRFKTPSDLSDTTAQYLLGFSNSNGHYGVTYTNDGFFEIRLPQRNGGAYGYGILYQTNTWYSIKSVIQNNGCETFLYDNTGTQIGHVNFTQFWGSFSLDSVLNIGKDTILDFEQSGVQGSVDLNNTYITINGNLWFYGKNYSSKNIAPVPAGFTYGSTTTNAIGWVDMRTQAFTAAPEGAGYNEVPVMPSGGIDENTLACFHFDEGNNVDSVKSFDSARGLGPFGYGKTTTSSDCVKFGDSGLLEDSDGSYRVVVNYGITTTTDWSIDHWWYTGTSSKLYQVATYSISTSGYFSTTHGVLFDKANNIVALVNGSAVPSIVSSVSYTFPANTMVHVATCRDITNEKTYAFVDGVKVLEVADTTQNPSDSQLTIYGSPLKVDEVRFSNNVRWTDDFSVPTEAYSRESAFKECFATIGSPTITDRVASGFSNANYLMTGNFLNKTTSSFEVGTCIKMNQILSDNLNYGIIDSGLKYLNAAGSYSYDKNIRLTVTNDKIRLRMVNSNNSEFVDITGTTSVQADSKLYVKATFDTVNGYALYTSTDKTNWTLEGSNSTTTLPNLYCYANIAIGTNGAIDYNYGLKGSIYLDETYIKVDGNVVWKPYVE